MAKEKPRRKNKRLKNYNYTEKREKLLKVVAKHIEEGEIVSQRQMAREAGYTSGSPNVLRAIPEMVEEIYPTREQLDDHINITKFGDEYGMVKLKGHDMLYKLRGSYAPIKTANLNINDNLTDEEKRAIEAISRESSSQESQS